MSAPRDVVTGAYGFTGRHIAALLKTEGRTVATLTSRRGGGLEEHPLDFSRPDRLEEALKGADTLYNTYWVRYEHGRETHARAVENSRTLFQAAARAGVRRVVHVSIANPDQASELTYYRGKAQVEEALAATGLSHAILRPTVLYGDDDILINNIAWMLRRFPVMPLFGGGRYPIQPIFVGDMARLAVDAARRTDDFTVDAVGERWEYRELLRFMAGKLGRRVWMPSVGRTAANLLSKAMGLLVGDVVLTDEEYLGLTRGLLGSSGPVVGTTRLEGWLETNLARVGREYRSEVRRHFK